MFERKKNVSLKNIFYQFKTMKKKLNPAAAEKIQCFQKLPLKSLKRYIVVLKMLLGRLLSRNALRNLSCPLGKTLLVFSKSGKRAARKVF